MTGQNFEALQQRVDASMLEIERLRLLLDISKAMSSELELKRLLQLIMDKTKEVLDADRCSVFLLDSAKNELWTKVAHGMEGREIRIPATKGIVGHVAGTGITLNVKDAYESPLFDREVDKRTGYRTRTILSMPMKNRRGETIGVFQVLNKHTGVFTESDEELLAAVAFHASIAVENAQLYEEQKESFNSFVETLAATIDARDPLTSGHSARVMKYSQAIMDVIGMPPQEKEMLKNAALLHDFGKIGVPESVLFKDGRLDDREFLQIKSHVMFTKKILQNIKFSKEFRDIPLVAAAHHEKYNGKGYVEGLTGESIPPGSRILAVADVFDAITSRRHYRDRMPIEKVLTILQGDAGTHFDRRYVDFFFQVKIDVIMEALLFDSEVIVPPDDKEYFKRFGLNDLYSACGRAEKTGADRQLIECFNKYYQYGVDTQAAAMD